VREIKLPIGEFSNWDLVIPKNIPKGSFNLPLVVRGKNGLEARYWIQGKVDILKEVPIAERSLSMGERVQLEDFRYQWQSITHATDGPPSKNLLVGLKIKIPVNANQVIWSRHLEKDKALKKGDQVRVFSKEGTWELSTLAIAEKDAELGDRVNLKTSGNKKILSGIVVGKGEVQVK
jgi:flagella basal body P-ring formation protein FlgA